MHGAHHKSIVPRSNDEDVQYFLLAGLLPDTMNLTLYLPLGTASLLALDELGNPHLVAQEQFTNNEMLLLVPLLTNYPYYCPYEVLYASFTYGRMGDTSVARARKTLQDAKRAADGENMELRPLRNVLSRTRIKLRRLGIETTSMIEVGYVLHPLPIKEPAQEAH